MGPRGCGHSRLAAPSFLPLKSPPPTHLGSQGGEHKASCGVGPGPGWATAHFLQPHPCTSKTAGGPVVTPQLPRSQQRGRVNTSSWQLSRLQQLQSSQGGQPCGQRGSPAGWRPEGGVMGSLLCFLLPPHGLPGWAQTQSPDTFLVPRACPGAGAPWGGDVFPSA